MGIGMIVALVGIVCIYLFLRRLYGWEPQFAPLATAPDDPLMLEAQARARDTLAHFLDLARGPRDNAMVKLRFVSNAGEAEYLWAEVLEILGGDELGVRLVTPPVTHTGQLERLYRCRLDEVVDWQVRDADGKIHGGYTQRAMFAIARRDRVRLPKRLARLEAEYRDG